MKRIIAFVEEVIEMSETGQKEIRWNHDTYLHVYREDLAGTGKMVDEYDKLHPAFPLICLFPVQYGRLEKG